MKANRKFKDGEEAVSAVIGVILMVAITVAIAATVYVYVSGMMGTGQESAPNITFQKNDKATVNELTVISADPVNVAWGDLELLEDGSMVAHGMTGTVEAGNVLDISTITNSTAAYTISIRHVPTNTLVGTYEFTAGS
jgi:flagellin-like protein